MKEAVEIEPGMWVEFFVDTDQGAVFRCMVCRRVIDTAEEYCLRCWAEECEPDLLREIIYD